MTFVGQHGQWGLLESYALALCRMLLLPPATGEGRSPICATSVRIHKPKALGGAAVPAVSVSRDERWSASELPVTLGAGVAVDLLEEAPTTGAYRVSLVSGAAWPLPVDVAAFVVAGQGVAGGSRIGVSDTLPRGAAVTLVASEGGLTALLVGRSLRLFGAAGSDTAIAAGNPAEVARGGVTTPAPSAAARAKASSEAGKSSSRVSSLSPSVSPSAPESCVLLLDNYDSYTHNLAHLIAKVTGTLPCIVPSDAFDTWDALLSGCPPIGAVVVSPGPGRPDVPADFGLCAHAYSSGLPVRDA